MKKLALPALPLLAAAALTSGPALAQDHSPVPAAHHNYDEQLSADNSVLLLVDLQDLFGLTISSIDQTNLANNAAGIAEAAKVFNVPTILTTANAKTFAGPFFAAAANARKDLTIYDRTSINAWTDPRIVGDVHKTGRKKIIIGGLWTASCVMLPALAALSEGYDVYVLTDVSGDINRETHERAVQRLVQAGATPITWVALMLEWQKDWARKDTAGLVIEIAKKYGGAWGLAASYAGAMHVGSESK